MFDMWSGNDDDLEWPSTSFTYCKPFQMQFYVQFCAAADKISTVRLIARSLCNSWGCFQM